MDLDLVIRGGTVGTSTGRFEADVGVRDGSIVALGAGLPPGRSEIDARGRLVLPGGVDSHAHIEQLAASGLNNADSFETATASAALGGTTTVISFAAQHVGMSLKDVVADYHARATRGARIDYAFHLILADPNPRTLAEDVPALVEAGHGSLKLFMTYDRLRVDDELMLDVLAAARGTGALVCVHAENHGMISWMGKRLVARGYTAPRFHGISHPRVSEAEAFVRLAGAADGQSNTLTDIAVGDRAVVTHVKTHTAGHDTHLATWIIGLGAGSDYRGFQFTESPKLARNQMFVLYQGSGAKLDLSGAFLARGTEHIDTTLVVDHAEPGCESRELFKGVLDGAARGVFQGKIVVRQKAQKTDGKQMAQALMLSENAEFDSKPELEIYADDVVCGHGSTSAQLDPDLVFYCRARGIPEAEARALLTESFIGEAIDRVEDTPLREALMETARRWLRTAG